ncbi:hypothetical protein BDD12DRAFT_896709 [Trichophaea hybrida]|nr:hypothetical protein BDD12DRAFT_896709 [Trichophaea hybrida]
MEGGEIDVVRQAIRGSKNSLCDEESSNGAELPVIQPTLLPVVDVDLDIAQDEFERENEEGYSTEASEYIGQMRRVIVDLHTHGIPDDLDSDDTEHESIADSTCSMDDLDIQGSVTPPGNVNVDSDDEENDRRPFTISIREAVSMAVYDMAVELKGSMDYVRAQS